MFKFGFRKHKLARSHSRAAGGNETSNRYVLPRSRHHLVDLIIFTVAALTQSVPTSFSSNKIHIAWTHSQEASAAITAPKKILFLPNMVPLGSYDDVVFTTATFPQSGSIQSASNQIQYAEWSDGYAASTNVTSSQIDSSLPPLYHIATS